jgi:hypothetical protein
MDLEQMMERKLAVETKILREIRQLQHYPPQIPHHLIWDRTRATVEGNPATDHLSYATAIL